VLLCSLVASQRPWLGTLRRLQGRAARACQLSIVCLPLGCTCVATDADKFVRSLCCWSARSELETDKRIASSLTGGMGQLSLNQPPPPPAVSAWGSGPPPAIKPAGLPDMGAGPSMPGADPSFFETPLPGAGFGMSHLGGGGFGSMDQMSSAGDFLDPMGGGNMGLSQGSNGSRGADSSSAWDAACSSIDPYGGGGSSSDPSSNAVMEPFGGANCVRASQVQAMLRSE
jgi:hypothetical protein